jgi:hypothetical protein
MLLIISNVEDCYHVNLLYFGLLWYVKSPTLGGWRHHMVVKFHIGCALGGTRLYKRF